MLISTLSFSQNFFRVEYTVLISYLGCHSQGLSDAQCSTMAADPSSLTANVPSSSPAMASDLVDKINCLTLARTKLERELDINHECIFEAIERTDRTIKIKNWLQSCKQCSEKAVSKNEKMFFLTSRKSDKAALEHCLELLRHKNDGNLTKA